MRLVATVIGAMYVTLCYKMPELIHLEPIRHVLLAFIVLFPVTLALAAFSERESWFVALFVLVGIGIGVMIDAFSDKVDRNLFPIEIMWWSVLLAPAIIAGTTLGWWMRKNRRNKPSERTQ